MDKENKMSPGDDKKSLGINDHLIADCEIIVLVEGGNIEVETVHNTKKFEPVFFNRLNKNDHIDFSTHNVTKQKVLTNKITMEILKKQVMKI